MIVESYKLGIKQAVSINRKSLEDEFNTYKNDFKKLFPSSFLKIFENG